MVCLASFVKRCWSTAMSRLEKTPEITCSAVRWRPSIEIVTKLSTSIASLA